LPPGPKPGQHEQQPSKTGRFGVERAGSQQKCQGQPEKKGRSSKKARHLEDKEFPVIIAWLRLHIFKFKENRVIVPAAN
jgi:hypothetical protein